MAEGNRDVRNHYLFEVATEVANRGMKRPAKLLGACLTKYSRWHILRDQVESSSHNSRIWR
jgi:hypothetical protein